MTVRSTKTRTAALRVSVRSQPLPWCGNTRIVRSISARRLLMLVRRSITISRNCSQKSGSTLIDVYRPLSQTLWTFGDLSPYGIPVDQSVLGQSWATASQEHQGECRLMPSLLSRVPRDRVPHHPTLQAWTVEAWRFSGAECV